jgi:hypothetical protein
MYWQYKGSAPTPMAPTRSPSPVPEDKIDFLTSLAMVLGADSASTENVASEFERYITLGTVSRHDIMENLLI